MILLQNLPEQDLFLPECVMHYTKNAGKITGVIYSHRRDRKVLSNSNVSTIRGYLSIITIRPLIKTVLEFQLLSIFVKIKLHSFEHPLGSKSLSFESGFDLEE